MPKSNCSSSSLAKSAVINGKCSVQEEYPVFTNSLDQSTDQSIRARRTQGQRVQRQEASFLLQAGSQICCVSSSKQMFNGHDQQQGQQTWTFSSSGWLFVYFFGVIQALRDTGMHRYGYIIGSAGGACAGMCMLVNADIPGILAFIKMSARDARRSWRYKFNIERFLARALEMFLPPDAGPAVSRRIEISVTLLPFLRNVRLNNFHSNKQLEDAVLASACVTRLPMHMPGLGWVMGGCFSNSQIRETLCYGLKYFTMHGERPDAISVCPFYMSRADIKPSKYIPPWWAMLPPSPRELQGLFELGYQDTIAWLRANGQLPPGNPPPPQAVAGAWGWFERLVGYLLWFVIWFELITYFCLVLACLPLAALMFGVDEGESCKIAGKNIWVLMKTIASCTVAIISSLPSFTSQPIITQLTGWNMARELQEHSLVYRIFFFMLQ